jgi:hypothetical protein
MRGDVDRAVERLSRLQHGAWSRRQVLAAGASGSLIDRRLRSGAWVRLDSGVYGSPAAPPTWHRSVMAAVLGGLAIAHRAVDTRVTRISGIPCVTLDQVFIDLAQVTSAERLGDALARATDLDRRLLDQVRDRYAALAPRGGRDLRNLRTVLEQLGAGDGITESELERRMRRLFTRPEVPPITWQASFPGRVPGPRRVDGLIEAWRIVLEGDGRAWHTRVDDFERDRRRDQAAAAAGHLTLRYTYNQISTDPDWCLATLLDAGASRAFLDVGGIDRRPATAGAPNLNRRTG